MRDEDGKEVHENIQLRFVDSFRFMASSPAKLASNLDDDQCKNLREFYRKEEVFRLMRRKGVYPHEYMDASKKFGETSLPSKDAFYSRLNMKGISDQDYEYAEQVWNIMEKKTLVCYHNTYLKTDILMLAHVFETFQNTRLKSYKLDPAHFYKAPGLGWQALLKPATEYCQHEKRRKRSELCLAEFRPDLLTDIDMLLMVEKGIRGEMQEGVSFKG